MIPFVSVHPWRLLPLQHEQERRVCDCMPTVMVLFSQSCCCKLAKPWLHLRLASGISRLAAPLFVPSLVVEGKVMSSSLALLKTTRLQEHSQDENKSPPLPTRAVFEKERKVFFGANQKLPFSSRFDELSP